MSVGAAVKETHIKWVFVELMTKTFQHVATKVGQYAVSCPQAEVQGDIMWVNIETFAINTAAVIPLVVV
jgi:hypothetical protein